MIYYIIILIISIVLTFLNKGLWIGGDSEGVLNSTSLFQNYFWSENGLGGFAGGGLRFFSSVLDFFSSGINNYYVKSVLLLFLVIFGLISCYYIFSKKHISKISSLFLAIFIALNFVVWGGVSRQVYFICFSFIFTPLICYFVDKAWNKKDLKSWSPLILLGFVEGVIANNPGYFLPQAILILIFIIYKIIFDGKISIQRFLFLTFSLGWAPILVLINMVAFGKYNSAIGSDDWNNKTLLEGPLQRQKSEMGLFLSFRGLNLDVYDSYGYDNGKIFHPYPNYNILVSNIGIIISWLPIFFIIIGFFFIKDKNTKNRLFFRNIIFLIAVFISKSAGSIGGDLFSMAMKNIPGFGIFRNPHQKLAIIYIFSLFMQLILILKYFKNSKYQKFFIAGLSFYSLIISFPYIFGNFIPKTMKTQSIPNSYFDISSKINSDNGIKRIISFPFNAGTWMITDWGYEGYNPFSFLLKSKSLWNRNDLAFSSYNSIILRDFTNMIVQNGTGYIFHPYLDQIMEKYGIDTILFDGYTYNFDRFHSYDDHDGYLNFLTSNKNLDLKYQQDKIYIFQNKIVSQTGIFSAKKIDFEKVNPTKYNLSIKNLTGKQDISFLQSYHPERKLFPSSKNVNCGINKQQKYNSYAPVSGQVLTGNYITLTSGDRYYDIYRKYSKTIWSIQDYNDKSLLFAGSGDKIMLGYKYTTGTVMKQTGTGNITECINDGYKFFEGDELGFLTQKPVFDETHKLVNDYANGWTLDAETIKKTFPKDSYSINPDGSVNVNLTLYFRPQSWFYVGLGISGFTLLTLLLRLLLDAFRKPKIFSTKNENEHTAKTSANTTKVSRKHKNNG